MKRTLVILLMLVVVFGSWAQGKSATASTKPVTILATWGGDEEAGFREVLDRFTAETGIPYSYEGNRDSTVVLKSRVASSNPPDIAILPRPGEVANYARQGVLIPLNQGQKDDILPTSLLDANYGKAWIDLGTVDGKFYGLIVKANSKSTFWYKPASFASLGVKTPDTWEDLLKIADKYVAAGKKPLAIGAQDGWTLTDWFENIYVRTAGPDMYMKLHVTHEVKWTDPTVVTAIKRFIELVTPTDKKLAGGADGALSTGFIDGFNEVLRPNAAAEMYYEGGFMSSFAAQNFPNLTPGKDYDFFDFPSIDSKWGKPVVGGGDLAVVFSNRPEVVSLMRFLAGKEANTIWASAKKGAVVSPNKNVDLSVYPLLTAKEARQLTQATSFVFDGSDLAPPAVGGDAEFVALQRILKNPDKYMEALNYLEGVASQCY
ncbi:MAG TPA: extracellular solute-binding protein [Rectinema sp.]|nr:extracellular solute-binding protein [Rectinema sp.]HOR49336.1 extracellular solute-binding protein [Rectinema sp.]HPL71858.1 extracellular solute-binding protein [Rectinema sp.]